MATAKKAAPKKPERKPRRETTPAERRNAFNKLAGWPQKGTK